MKAQKTNLDKTGQQEDATGRIRLQLIGVELIAQAYVENAGYNCVAGLRGLTNDDRQAGRRWKRGEGFPVDVFGQDRSENAFTGVVRLSDIFVVLP